jgi:hypothetical protein
MRFCRRAGLVEAGGAVAVVVVEPSPPGWVVLSPGFFGSLVPS